MLHSIRTYTMIWYKKLKNDETKRKSQLIIYFKRAIIVRRCRKNNFSQS